MLRSVMSAGWESFALSRDGFVVSGRFRGDRQTIEQAAQRWLDQTIAEHRAWQEREAARRWYQRVWDRFRRRPRFMLMGGFTMPAGDWCDLDDITVTSYDNEPETPHE